MRTPVDELAHAAGFCLAEGIIDAPDDIKNISCCDGTDSNVVTITLEESRQSKITDLLDIRGYISQTSCGICGKALVEDLRQLLKPIDDHTRMDAAIVLDSLLAMGDYQPCLFGMGVPVAVKDFKIVVA